MASKFRSHTQYKLQKCGICVNLPAGSGQKKKKKRVEPQKGGCSYKIFFAISKGIEMQVKWSSQEPNL